MGVTTECTRFLFSLFFTLSQIGRVFQISCAFLDGEVTYTPVLLVVLWFFLFGDVLLLHETIDENVRSLCSWSLAPRGLSVFKSRNATLNESRGLASPSR